MEGYFKVHRKILTSQVFAHQTALKIWVWCMAKVTFKERFVSLKIGKGETTVKLLPGQFIFGRFKAEEELNIDGSTIYKWMQKFASPEFDMILIESNNQYSVITLCNWEQYQNGDEDEVTTKEQPSNNQVTAKEQPSNTNNKDNNDNKVKKNIYSEFYDSEILKSNNNSEYIFIVDALYGKNNLGIPLTVLLKMPTQLSFAQFEKIWYLKEKYKFSIIQIFEKMQDWGNPKKRTTIYNTFLTFAKNEKPEIKC